MDQLRIELPESARYCLPGALLEGQVEWQFAKAPKSVELELHCYTDGSISGQNEIMEKVVFDAPSIAERRTFQIRVPAQPYSFEGTLFKIQWELELRVDSGKHSEIVPLILSATGEPVRGEKVD